MNKWAMFSEDRTQRYLLARVWDTTLEVVTCVGLNPSTANEEKDDSTIRYLMKVFRSKGYGGIAMTNLYSVVSSDPKKLMELWSDQQRNEEVRKDAIAHSSKVIFCWGNFEAAYFPSQKLIREYPNAWCFGKTALGRPMHPQAFARRGIRPEGVPLIPFNTKPKPENNEDKTIGNLERGTDLTRNVGGPGR